MKNLIIKIVKEDNFISLFGNVVFAALGFIAFLILTRSLSLFDFGQWIIYITIATLIDLLRFGLTRTAVVRFISGINKYEKQSFIATSMLIGIVQVFVIVLLLWSFYFFFSDSLQNSGYQYFLLFYPFLAISNLSWNNALSLLQAEQKFDKILFLRAINVASFVIFLVINKLFFNFGIKEIIIANIFSNLIASIYSFIKGWDGLLYIQKASILVAKKILNFGKFSIGTAIGSSLLRSADAFIIGLSPFLGPSAVALYAIPLKFVEILEIPLRSFTATAFPKMSRASLKNNIAEFKNVFYTYSGAISFLFIPLLIAGFVFANKFVWILGGSEYKDSAVLLGNIFRIFCIYALLLPIDRLTGVALDSINLPKLNFLKVMIMMIANIIGDLIAVFAFKSLTAVAVVTVLFTLTGVFLGWFYLKKKLQLNFFQIGISGINFYKFFVNRFLSVKIIKEQRY